MRISGSARHSSHRLALASAAAVIALLRAPAAAPLGDQTDSGYETAPVLVATEILPVRLLSSDHHVVAQEVQNDGAMNFFRIDSDFGTFEVYGELMLRIRVREIQVLSELAEMSKSQVFIEAAVKAGLAPTTPFVSLFSRPVATVRGLPGGVKSMFARYSRQAREGAVKVGNVVAGGQGQAGQSGGEAAANDETPKSEASAQGVVGAGGGLADRYLGVGSAERRWAAKLGTDPYTSNETLRQAIRTVARVDRAGGLGMKFAPRLRVPGASYVKKVNQAVWTKDPVELRRFNVQRLQEQGVDGALIEAFLENPFFSPTLQTLVITELLELEGVEGRGLVARDALEVASEEEARFFVRSVQMLEHFHRTEAPLLRLLGERGVPPFGESSDGRVVSFLPTDHVVWTEEIAGVAKGITAGVADVENERRELWLTGQVSPRTRSELAELGWAVRAGIAMEEENSDQ